MQEWKNTNSVLSPMSFNKTMFGPWIEIIITIADEWICISAHQAFDVHVQHIFIYELIYRPKTLKICAGLTVTLQYTFNGLDQSPTNVHTAICSVAEPSLEFYPCVF